MGGEERAHKEWRSSRCVDSLFTFVNRGSCWRCAVTEEGRRVRHHDHSSDRDLATLRAHRLHRKTWQVGCCNYVADIAKSKVGDPVRTLCSLAARGVPSERRSGLGLQDNSLRAHRTWILKDSNHSRGGAYRHGRKTMYFRSPTTYCLFGLLQSAIWFLDAHAAAPQTEWTSNHAPQATTIMTPAGKEIFQIMFSCRSPQPTANVVIYGERYRGSVLKRVETDLPFILEVQRASGGGAKFPVILYYTSADGGAWVSSGSEVTTAFFDAFAHDGRLIWRTGGGAQIASWSLKGSAEARESIRAGCNF